jgi:hypothetical protein
LIFSAFHSKTGKNRGKQANMAQKVSITTDLLAEWIKKNPAKRRRDVVTVAFLSVKTEIKTYIDAGYALRTIWDFFVSTGRLSCSYETFRQCVKKFITSQAPVAVTPSSEQPKEQGRPPKPPKATEELRGFTFDPTPKKEDLI